MAINEIGVKKWHRVKITQTGFFTFFYLKAFFKFYIFEEIVCLCEEIALIKNYNCFDS